MGRHKIPDRTYNPKVADRIHARLVKKDTQRIAVMFENMAALLGIKTAVFTNAVDWGLVHILNDRYKYIPGVIPMKKAVRIVCGEKSK